MCRFQHLFRGIKQVPSDQFGHEICLFIWGLTARQHRIGQFVPTTGGWNRLSWLRMANETQCIILNTLHNVTQFTIKHSSYKNATTGYLIVWLTCLKKYYVSAFNNTKSDHTLPIRFNNFTRWDAALRHAQDIVWQFTLLHIAQYHDKKKIEYCQFFSRVLVLGNSMRIDKRQSIQLCSPHTTETWN